MKRLILLTFCILFFLTPQLAHSYTDPALAEIPASETKLKLLVRLGYTMMAESLYKELNPGTDPSKAYDEVRFLSDKMFADPKGTTTPELEKMMEEYVLYYIKANDRRGAEKAYFNVLHDVV